MRIDLPVNLTEELDCLINVHLLMDVAEVLVILGWCETHLVFASQDLNCLELLLSEVEAFLGVQLETDGHVEVFV